MEVQTEPASPGISKPKSIRVFWKWSLLATVLVVGYFAWQCGSGFVAAARLSDAAVQQFHTQLDAGDFEGIFHESDEGFQKADAKESTLKFLAGVHDKLGKSGRFERGSIHINAQISTTFVTVTYNSTFQNGTAQETFTWRKTGGALKLISYNVQSNAFISR